LLLNDGGYTFRVAWTSVLKRAIQTLWIVMDDLDLMYGAPVVAAERDELRRSAGLQNTQDTQEATRENGVEMVHLWRRTVTCGRRRSHGTIPATRD
jgi:2,3-bisphosphoglycerate-dependent phosphoglycerate mutase